MSTDNTAKILAKGCKSTGVTEDLARRLFENPGMKLMAIVELQPSSRHIKKDDKQVVDLEILAIEPVIGEGPTAEQADEHVRTLQAALYRNRKLAEGNDEPLPYDGDGPEPTVKDVLQQGIGLFSVDDDLDDDEDEHDDESDEPDRAEAAAQLVEDWEDSKHGDEPEDPDDESYEPHAYIDTAFATCGHQGCGQPAGAAVHYATGGVVA